MKLRDSIRRHAGELAFGGVAALLLLAVLLLGLFGWWSLQRFSEQASRYRTYKALEHGSKDADSLFQAQVRSLGEIEGFLQTAPRPQASQVLNTLVKEARALQLGLSGVNALDEIPFPGYTELPFEVGLAGGFTNLLRYLHALETGNLALRVRRISVSSESLNHAKIQARLELSVYVPKGGA